MPISPKLGLVSWCGLTAPFADRMAMIRDAGFTATALWWEDRHEYARRMKHLAPQIVRDAGLIIDHIHVPYRHVNRLWSPDAEERNNGLRMYEEWIEDCAQHNVDTMVMHATLGRDAPTHIEIGIESFHHLTDFASERGVRIALENMRDAPRIEEMLAAIPSPALGLCYDLAHDTLFSESPGRILDTCGTRFITTHLNDHDGKRDRHWIPGDGVAQYDSAMTSIKSVPRAPRIMIEAKHNPKNESESQFLERAHAAAHRLVNA